MGVYSSRFFDGSGQWGGLTRGQALEWLLKDEWTLEEASYLLSGFDPRTISEGQQYAEETFSISPCPLEADVIREAMEKEQILSNLDGAVFWPKFMDVTTKVTRDASGDPKAFSYPVRAYLRFALWHLFPNDERGWDVPCFGLFHDDRAESDLRDSDRFLVDDNVMERPEGCFLEALSSAGLTVGTYWQGTRRGAGTLLVRGLDAPSPSLSSDPSPVNDISVHASTPVPVPAPSAEDLEVVPGLTVDALRRLLDEEREGETFRPLLCAAVRAACRLDEMKEEAGPAFRMVHGKPVEGALNDLIEEELKGARVFNVNDKDKGATNRTLSKEDINALRRVCRLLRESRTGNQKGMY